jgi:SAM-dependent methyltransferase
MPRVGEEPRFPLAVHVCNECGLLQIVDPAPPEQLYFDAENYATAAQRHPHVDELIRTVLAHTEARSVVEIGCNDGAFLDSLRSAGFAPLTGIEPNRRAAELAAGKGLSVHRALFDEDVARQIEAAQGPSDLVAARHVLEHVTDVDAFFRALGVLLKPDGWFLLELPHTEPGLEAGNPCLLWEEHVSYFLEPVILAMLARYGYRPMVQRLYTFGGGVIAFLARRLTAPEPVAPGPLPRHSIAAYGGRVAAFRDGLRALVWTAKDAGWDVAVYGAANRSCMVVNHAAIGGELDAVIDDRPDLNGQILPGAAPPILPLEAVRITGRGLLCLMGVGAEAERKVAARVRERFNGLPVVFASLVYPRDSLAEFGRAAAAIEPAGGPGVKPPSASEGSALR